MSDCSSEPTGQFRGPKQIQERATSPIFRADLQFGWWCVSSWGIGSFGFFGQSLLELGCRAWFHGSSSLFAIVKFPRHEGDMASVSCLGSGIRLLFF